MDSASIARWRMRSLRLWEPSADAPERVVTRLGASQAQDYLPGKWSIAQRSAAGLTDAGLDASFDEGRVLRTHVLRPTWHFVAPADIRWLLAATRDRVHAANAPYYRRFGLDGPTLDRSAILLEEALAAGRHLTRGELADHLREKGIVAEGPRLAYILMHAELEGLVASGVRRGRQQTYALLSERAPATDAPAPKEARVELVRRYFASRGPATVKDLCRWATLTVADAKSAIDSVGSELTSIEVDGRTYWFARHAGPDPHSPGEAGGPRIDLVQSYDESIMSYSESKDVLRDNLLGTAPVPATFVHAVLLDGRLLGHWRYNRDGRGVPTEIQTRLYRVPSRAERRALDSAVARFGDFVRAPATWS